MNREEVYNQFVETYPLYENPQLNEEEEMREMLISCMCGAGYRIIANGCIPIVTISNNITCKNCGKPAKNQIISGHSGGIFNATIRKIT